MKDVMNQTAANATADTVVDTAPRRVRDWNDVVRAITSLLLTATVIAIAVYLQGTTQGVEDDVHRVGNSLHWLVQLPLSFILSATMVVIVIAIICQLLFQRLWIQTLTAGTSILTGLIVANVFTLVVTDFFYDSLGWQMTQAHNWLGTGPFELFTALLAFLAAANSHSMRKRLKWAWNTFFVLVFIVLAVDAISLTSLLVSVGLGYAVGVALRFAFGTPNTGVWGQDLVDALAAVNIHATSLQRLDFSSESAGENAAATDSTASATAVAAAPAATSTSAHAPVHTPVRALEASTEFGDDLTPLSRLYRARTAEGTELTISVNDEQRHSASYLAQVWKGIKIQGLAIRQDRSVLDMTEHHMAMLLALRQLGLPVASPLAIGDAGESAFLVFKTPDQPTVPLDWASLTDDEAEQLIDMLERAHRNGITHRNITPSVFGRRPDGSLVIAGWTNGDVASSSAHQQIDRIQLLAIFAANLGIDRTVAIAQRAFSDKQLADIAPYAQAVAIPQATKQEAGWNRHLLKNLQSKLEALNPVQDLDSVQPPRLSRFNLRSFIMILLVVIALVAVFTQLNFDKMITAVKDADPWWAIAACISGIVSWAGSGVAFGVFIDKDQRKGHYDGILGTQAVASFTAVSMPAAAGPIVVNIQFLRKIGYNNTRATAIASADMVAEFSTTLLMFIALGIFTGQSAIQNALPSKTILIVIAAIAVGLGIAMLIPAVRKWLRVTALPTVKSYGRQLIGLFSHPDILLISMLGSVVQNTTLAMSFWFSLFAFGYHLDLIKTIFFFLLGNTIGSAAPTPGGLGAVEAVLSATFIGIGVPPVVAVSATLLYRLASYWLRMVLGFFYMKYMEKKKML